MMFISLAARMAWRRASYSSILFVGRGSLVESAAFTGRGWSWRGSRDGKLRVFAVVGRPLKAALLPEEWENMRPHKSAPAVYYSTALATRDDIVHWSGEQREAVRVSLLRG